MDYAANMRKMHNAAEMIKSSGAKEKQATQRGAGQTSNSHQRDAGWVFFRR